MVELERAVEILNERRHRGWDDWSISRPRHGGEPYAVQHDGSLSDYFEPFEAIAIAGKYEGTIDRLTAELSEARAALAAARERVAALEGAWPVRTSSIHIDGPLLSRHVDSGGYHVLGYRPDGSRYSERLHPDRHSAIAAALAPAEPPAT